MGGVCWVRAPNILDITIGKARQMNAEARVSRLGSISGPRESVRTEIRKCHQKLESVHIFTS